MPTDRSLRAGTVEPTAFRTLVAAAAVIGVAWGCSNGAGSTTPNPTVTSVSVTPPTASVAAGGTTQLSAVPLDASGATVSGQSIAWSSGSPGIASVSSTGLVTGVAPGGPVTISATAAGVTGTAMVTVTPVPVASVSVDPATASVVQGGTATLTATPKDAGGHTLSGRTVTWSSDNAALASVSSSGVVTGVAPGGPVTITATSEGKSGSAAVTVTLPPVAAVAISPDTSSVALGATAQLAATPKDAGGNPISGPAVTWSSSDATVATVSTSGLVTAVALGGPVTITATSEGINGTATIKVIAPSFNTAWLWRRQVTVTAASTDVPAGYSVPVQLDHAGMVAAGVAMASGNDVRVAHWTGSQWVELNRVLDNGSAWNTGTTTIWFQTAAPIPASTSDTTYYVYYGNPLAAAAPANPDSVFLFSDDFESGAFTKWSMDNVATSHWAVDHSRAHSGTSAATYPAEPAQAENLFPSPRFTVDNVYFDVWWNISGLSNSWNMAQGLRQAASNGNKYYSLLCLCLGPSLGWNIAEYNNGVYTDLTRPGGTPTANSWMRVGTAMYGTTYRVFFNGAEIRELGGLTDYTSGEVAIYKYVVPPGLQVWVDDAVARRYVFPEPAASLGAQQPAP